MAFFRRKPPLNLLNQLFFLSTSFCVSPIVFLPTGKCELLRARQVSFLIVRRENHRELWQGVGRSFVIDYCTTMCTRIAIFDICRYTAKILLFDFAIYYKIDTKK